MILNGSWNHVIRPFHCEKSMLLKSLLAAVLWSPSMPSVLKWTLIFLLSLVYDCKTMSLPKLLVNYLLKVGRNCKIKGKPKWKRKEAFSLNEFLQHPIAFFKVSTLYLPYSWLSVVYWWQISLLVPWFQVHWGSECQYQKGWNKGCLLHLFSFSILWTSYCLALLL